MLSGPTSHLSSMSTKAAAVGGGLCLVESLPGGGWDGEGERKGRYREVYSADHLTVILRNEILRSWAGAVIRTLYLR